MAEKNTLYTVIFCVISLFFSSPEKSFADFDYSNSQIKRAYGLFEKGDLIGARRIYENLLKIDPDMFQAHFSLGIIDQKLNKPVQALEHFLRCVEIKPDYAPIYNNMGWIYLKSDLPDMAIFEFMRAIEKDSNYTLSYNNLGLAYMSQGMSEVAMSIFMEILKKDPKNLPALNNTGVLLENRGEVEKAEDYYKKVLSIDESNEPSLINLAGICSRTGRLRDGTELLRKAERFHPGSSNVLFARAVFSFQKGDNKTSEIYLQQILTINREDYRGMDLLTNVFIENGKLDKAESLQKKLLKKYPENYSQILRYCRILFLNMNYEKALSETDRIAHNPGSNSPAYYNLRGKILEGTGRLDSALSCYNRSNLLGDDSGESVFGSVRVYIQKEQLSPAEDLLKETNLPSYGRTLFYRTLLKQLKSDINKDSENFSLMRKILLNKKPDKGIIEKFNFEMKVNKTFKGIFEEFPRINHMVRKER